MLFLFPFCRCKKKNKNKKQGLERIHNMPMATPGSHLTAGTSFSHSPTPTQKANWATPSPFYEWYDALKLWAPINLWIMLTAQASAGWILWHVRTQISGIPRPPTENIQHTQSSQGHQQMMHTNYSWMIFHKGKNGMMGTGQSLS